MCLHNVSTRTCATFVFVAGWYFLPFQDFVRFSSFPLSAGGSGAGGQAIGLSAWIARIPDSETERPEEIDMFDTRSWTFRIMLIFKKEAWEESETRNPKTWVHFEMGRIKLMKRILWHSEAIEWEID